MAFEAEGFCVVRGPDVLLGGDIRRFHVPPHRFDGIIGGPPCKAFSVATASQGWDQGATEGNLVPEFERIIADAKPQWWIMENVRRSPIPAGATWHALLDAWDYGAAQHRTRRFSSNITLAPLPLPPDQRHPNPWPCITATEHKCSSSSSERTMRQRAGRIVGRRLTLEEINLAMGLPADYATPALRLASSYAVRGNGVPLQMGRAIACAVRKSFAT